MDFFEDGDDYGKLRSTEITKEVKWKRKKRATNI